MPKPKKYDTSQDEPRKVIMDALLRNMSKEKLTNETRAMWTAIVRIWEGSYDLRESHDTLFTSQQTVAEFLGLLERTLFLVLPGKLFQSLEGTCGQQ